MNKINSLIEQSVKLQIIKQLLREFWIPIIISIAWTVADSKGKNATELLQVGIVHFFAAGWAFSQWNRVAKQKKVEGDLKGVSGGIRELTERLEASAKDLIGHTTGGESYFYVVLNFDDNGNPMNIVIIHQGDYPLYDVNIRLCDIALFDQIIKSGSGQYHLTDKHLAFTTLLTGQGYFRPIGGLPFVIENNMIRFNVFSSARNGGLNQQTKFYRASTGWIYAIKIQNHRGTIYEKVDPNFPIEDGKTSVWD